MEKLFQNIIAFLLGIIIIVTPFCIYFYKYDALYEMWYGTLFYNFDYLANTSIEQNLNFLDSIYFIRASLPGWCLLAISSWKIICKKQYSNLFWLVCVASNIAFIFSYIGLHTIVYAYPHIFTLLLQCCGKMKK